MRKEEENIINGFAPPFQSWKGNKERERECQAYINIMMRLVTCRFPSERDSSTSEHMEQCGEEDKKAVESQKRRFFLDKIVDGKKKKEEIF